MSSSKELSARIEALEAEIKKLREFQESLIPTIQALVEDVTGIKQAGDNYANGKMMAAGFGSLITFLKDLAEVKKGQAPAPTQGAPAPTPPAQVNPFNMQPGVLPDLSGVQWYKGQYGESVYSKDYPALYQALQALGGKADYGTFTLNIGKNTDYINKREKKAGGAQGGGQRPAGPVQLKNPNAPATEKQIGAIQKMGGVVTPGMTMAQASATIDYLKKMKGQA